MIAYELMFVLNPELEEETTEAEIQRVQSIIKQDGGLVAKLDKWGKRRLAYEINDFREGYYVLLNFLATPAVAIELDRVMKINENYLRFLLIRDETVKEAEIEEKLREAVEEAAKEVVEETMEDTAPEVEEGVTPELAAEETEETEEEPMEKVAEDVAAEEEAAVEEGQEG